ncbi:MAG TPA: hypothetical protein VEA80_07900 [Vitreimonas sp.]|uniref:hypothetical protein n=1 Tax=Vitreimonas sp. TaxID=3069702 RepID=UPI002D749B96|nr:hypothetical protein [Vitreimonas sp.]HYD87382.1 hypothetical protein [Vitreimonas sp.]
MRTRVLAAAALIVLVGCERAAERPSAPPTPPEPPLTLDLTCAAFAEVDNDALIERYGAENVSTEIVPGPEGQSYEATLLYANDPARRLEIVWRDEAKTAPAAVSAEGAGWTGPSGLAVGADLARVEELNGRPFRLWGFGWDYGGWVSEWNGGAFASAGGCTPRVHFDARTPNNTSALGDSEFASDSAEVRAADPAVTEIGLSFRAQ